MNYMQWLIICSYLFRCVVRQEFGIPNKKDMLRGITPREELET
jgi:hypothetical protein